MEVHLPDLKGKEKNTLYIIGNGFDLFHKVKTKFIHFYSWLNLKDEKHERFATEMENLFLSYSIHGNLLWRDFEKALGDLDINYVQEQYSGEEENKAFDEKYQKRATQIMHKTTRMIPSYLREWIAETDITKVTPKLPLSKDSLYLSFNYTLLLENVYHIPKERIVHIHHCYTDQEDLVTGHNKSFPTWLEHQNINVEMALQNISSEANALKKPVKEIIKQNSVFFDSLSKVSNIIVFGHSLSPIDGPYFEQVFRNVQDDAYWYFVCRNEDDKIRYQEKIKNYQSSWYCAGYLKKIENVNYLVIVC